MKEILPILLQAVLVATVPVCSAFLVHGIRALARYASTKMDNALAKKYLEVPELLSWSEHAMYIGQKRP